MKRLILLAAVCSLAGAGCGGDSDAADVAKEAEAAVESVKQQVAELQEELAQQRQDAAAARRVAKRQIRAAARREVRDALLAETQETRRTEVGQEAPEQSFTPPLVRVPPNTANCAPGYHAVGNEESEMCVQD